MVNLSYEERVWHADSKNEKGTITAFSATFELYFCGWKFICCVVRLWILKKLIICFFKFFGTFQHPKRLTHHIKTILLISIPNKRSTKPRLKDLNHLIVAGIQDKKGKKIVQLDLRKLGDAPADFFIICEGDSNTHVKAITDSIHKRVKDEMHTYPNHTEGSSDSKWVLLDYFNTVVHVFYPETREFYELEHLWSDADVTEFGEV